MSTSFKLGLEPHASHSVIAHALGAPLCALEVVLAAKDHLPEEQAELLEAAVARLRDVLQALQVPM